MLDEIWRKKLNAHFLLWQSGKLGFYIYLVKEPKFQKNDLLDLTGLKLRSHAAYKEWFELLNATNVVIPGPEMFSAFERGMLDGTGWSAIAFADLGVEKFVKYRVGPSVWQLDILVIANAPKWDALPQNARDIITKAAIEHEIETMGTYQAAAKKEEEFLKKAGIQLIELTGDRGEKHVKAAHDVIWERMQKRAPENAKALREKLYQ